MTQTRSGLTIAELVIAAALLCTGLLPVVAFSQRGLAESEATRDEIVARQALMDLCDRYKGEDPVELERVAADPARIESDELLMRPSGLARALDLKRTVRFARDVDGVTGLHELTFVVAWTGRRAHRLELHRLVHAH